MKSALHRATETLWHNIAAAKAGNEDAIAALFLLYGNPGNPQRLCAAAFDALCGLGLVEFEREVG